MSHLTLVWAFKCIPELDSKLGFVECDSDKAEKLIKAGKVQDPAVGALHLNEIDNTPAPVEKPKAAKLFTAKK